MRGRTRRTAAAVVNSQNGRGQGRCDERENAQGCETTSRHKTAEDRLDDRITEQI